MNRTGKRGQTGTPLGMESSARARARRAARRARQEAAWAGRSGPVVRSTLDAPEKRQEVRPSS
jgi:hypothetical protein